MRTLFLRFLFLQIDGHLSLSTAQTFFQKHHVHLPRAGSQTSPFPLAAGNIVEHLRSNDADETVLTLVQ